MKLKVSQSVSNVDTFDDLKRFVDQYLSSIRDVINGNVDLNDNMSVSFVTFTFQQANTNYQLAHTLGRIPTGYIPVKKNSSADIYDGAGTNTAKSIFLKSTVATTVTVMVF